MLWLLAPPSDLPSFAPLLISLRHSLSYAVAPDARSQRAASGCSGWRRKPLAHAHPATCAHPPFASRLAAILSRAAFLSPVSTRSRATPLPPVSARLRTPLPCPPPPARRPLPVACPDPFAGPLPLPATTLLRACFLCSLRPSRELFPSLPATTPSRYVFPLPFPLPRYNPPAGSFRPFTPSPPARPFPHFCGCPLPAPQLPSPTLGNVPLSPPPPPRPFPLSLISLHTSFLSHFAPPPERPARREHDGVPRSCADAVLFGPPAAARPAIRHRIPRDGRSALATRNAGCRRPLPASRPHLLALARPAPPRRRRSPPPSEALLFPSSAAALSQAPPSGRLASSFLFSSPLPPHSPFPRTIARPVRVPRRRDLRHRRFSDPFRLASTTPQLDSASPPPRLCDRFVPALGPPRHRVPAPALRSTPCTRPRTVPLRGKPRPSVCIARTLPCFFLSLRRVATRSRSHAVHGRRLCVCVLEAATDLACHRSASGTPPLVASVSSRSSSASHARTSARLLRRPGVQCRPSLRSSSRLRPPPLSPLLLQPPPPDR